MRAPTAWFRRGPSSHFVTEVRLHPKRPVEIPAIDRIRTFVDDLGRDLQYALRMLIKTPLLTGVTLLTLVLGIGANLAIFGIVNAVLLQPLPFLRPDRLVRVFDDLPGAGAKDVGMSVPEMADVRARTDVFEQVTGFISLSTALAGGDHVERVELLITLPNYFDVLGAKPPIGRAYTQVDWTPGMAGIVVISDGLWRRQFGGDPHVVGRRIRVDEDPYTIIGVMPPGFEHPAETVSGDVDIWAAAGFSADPFSTPTSRANRWFSGVIGRLKQGVRLEQAQSRADILAARLTKTYPADYPPQQGWSLRLQSAQASLTGDVRPTLALLFVAACFVLLVVCVNVASLLLARSTVRTREFAVRQAIGASAGRVARQVLTESILLSLVGGVLAVVVLATLPGRLLALIPGDVPRITEFHVDWRLAAVGLSLSIGAGILFGASPAWRAASISPIRDLNEGGRSGGAYGIRQRRVRATLVAVEVALSVVLLVGAGLLLRSFVAVLHEDPGIEPNGLLTGQIWVPYPNDPKTNRYLTPVQSTALVRRLLDRLAKLPGVSQVAIASSAEIPFAAALAGTEGPFSFTDDGETQASDHAAVFGTVSSQYFSVLGTSIKRGRDLTAHDDLNAPNVAMVNETFVKRFSAQRDPIGRTIRGPRGAEYRIVGVVADIHESGRDAPTIPHVYRSMFQFPTQVLAVFLRTRSEADAVREQLVGAVRDVDPELPVFAVRTMNEVMSESIARRRFVLSMVTAFAASALLLAAMGLYGVMSFLVAHRTQEFGIRLALGATPRSITMLAARPGLTLTGAGALLGLGLSFIAARLLSTLMFGVAANDAVTFASGVVLMFLVAIVASLIPARRATQASPMEALRS